MSTHHNAGTRSEQRLEIALEKALRWQNTLADDYSEVRNGHTYHGPHKWIFCLIGSDIYSVSTFSSQFDNALKAPNLSISIAALTGDALQMRGVEYKALTNKTSEGNFINIVKKAEADSHLSDFFSGMNVCPTDNGPIIKEIFQTM